MANVGLQIQEIIANIGLQIQEINCKLRTHNTLLQTKDCKYKKFSNVGLQIQEIIANVVLQM